jgi:hypothetical protein
MEDHLLGLAYRTPQVVQLPPAQVPQPLLPMDLDAPPSLLLKAAKEEMARDVREL